MAAIISQRSYFGREVHQSCGKVGDSETSLKPTCGSLWTPAYPDGRFQGSVELVVEGFGTEPNIEEVITEIESMIDSLENSDVLEDRLQRSLLGNTRGQLSVALREWFRELHLRPSTAYAR